MKGFGVRMSELTLISDYSLDTTALSNIYIDEYMSANNESQIKIYLFLLRNLSKGTPVSVITIADTFNYSVLDVERALFFMEKQGLMTLKMENECITGLKLLPLRKKRTEAYRESLQIEGFKLVEVPADKNAQEKAGAAKERASYMNELSVPAKPEYSKDELRKFKENEKIDELIFVIQAYTGNPLVVADLKSLKYIFEELSFSVELIDYLVESCVERKKKTFAYIEKVAIDWYLNGVKSIEDAKAVEFNVPDEVYEVFKAFGVKAGSRKPSAKEKTFVNKWTGQYAFSMDIIKKACEITVDRTHSVSFEYADAILGDWFKKGVKHLCDIQELTAERKTTEANSTGSRKSGRKSANSFNNFEDRDYDFAKLEKELWSN